VKRKIFVLLFLALGFGSLSLAQDLRIVVFSVGQTDSQLIIGPDKDLLIDCGAQVVGSKAQAEYVAQRIRDLTGRSTVDYLMISHYHYDHMGNKYPNSTKGNGLWNLFDMEGIKVDTVIDRGDFQPYGDATASHSNYVAKLATWKSEGKVKKRTQAQPGATTIDLGGGIKVDVIAVNGNGIFDHPSAEKDQHWQDFAPSENDYSVVLKITLGKFEYYSGGDVTGQDADRSFPDGTVTSYNDVESTFADKVGNVEVMRVSHHGSAFSTNDKLLSTLKPEFSVISSGENTYLHPDKGVVQRLREVSQVFVTSGVSAEEWQGDDSIRSEILDDDLEIDVLDAGDRYRIHGIDAQSFSDADEAAGLDHPGDATHASRDASGGSAAAPLIDWRQAKFHANENVTVRGKIVRTRKATAASFLNFSEQFWRDLTVVVFKEDLGHFPANFPQTYNAKNVQVTGKLRMFNGRPEIILKDTSQIKVIP
jgi:beta-lactamase superfamily II metal-dependent hydrolase